MALQDGQGHQGWEACHSARAGRALLEVGVALRNKPMLDQWIAAMPLSPALRAGDG